MLVSDSFVFLHLPKTGGTFVTEMLTALDQRTGGLRARRVPHRKHGGIGRIPPEARDRPVVVSVRNVFDHYLSRYRFRWWADPDWASSRFHLDRVRRDFPDFPDLSFAEFMAFINGWHYRRRMTGKGIDGLLNDLGIGLNTWELARICHPRHRHLLQRFDGMSDAELRAEFAHVRFLRTESLNHDLPDFLIEQGFAAADVRFIREAPPVLPKFDRGRDAASPQEGFDDALVRSVMQRDRLYFRLFPDMSPARLPAAGNG